MARSDLPAIRDTILLCGLMIGVAGAGIALWPTWWSVPFWLVYGVLYGSTSDSRWHETSHGTAFKMPWMNNVVYEIASFMIMGNPGTWRWSHVRHLYRGPRSRICRDAPATAKPYREDFHAAALGQSPRPSLPRRVRQT
jgi:hypothetical protein